MRKFIQSRLFLPAAVLVVIFIALAAIHLFAGRGPWMLVLVGDTVFHIHHDLLGVMLALGAFVLMKTNYFRDEEMKQVLKWIILLGIVLVIAHVAVEGLILVDVFAKVP